MNSSPSPTPFTILKQLVEQGDKEAIGRFLDGYRAYLMQIAAEELDPRLRKKAGDSDVVQLTLLEAGQSIGSFQAQSSEAMAAWLRKILMNNIANLRRAYLTDKRNIYREVTISGDDSSSFPLNVIDPAGTQSAAMETKERQQSMRDAFASLAEEFQQVIRLRTEQELSFHDVGLAMERSADAARKLWARAVEAFKVEIQRRTQP